MILQLSIDTQNGETRASAVCASITDHAAATKLLERVAPSIVKLQDAVLKSRRTKATK